ncbi:MAG: M48 family metallopeptidase [Thermoplasmatota archaeon]
MAASPQAPEPIPAPKTPISFEEEIRRNKIRSIGLVITVIVFLYLVILAVGFIIIGLDPLTATIVGTIGALLYVAFTYSRSLKTVIAASRARPADPNKREEKLLQYRVEEMAIAAGLPVPKVYVQDTEDINAFAAGLKPENSIICVTRGALDKLNQEELEGVIGHEMSHIVDHDVAMATLTIGLVGVIAIMAEIVIRVSWFGGIGGGRGGRGRGAPLPLVLVGLVFVIIAPILTQLVYLSLSRHREYLADAGSVRLTRNPEGLADALEKIRGTLPRDPVGSKTVAELYIANPWVEHRLSNLWSTHPPLEERIRRIRGMGG